MYKQEAILSCSNAFSTFSVSSANTVHQGAIRNFQTGKIVNSEFRRTPGTYNAETYKSNSRTRRKKHNCVYQSCSCAINYFWISRSLEMFWLLSTYTKHPNYWTYGAFATVWLSGCLGYRACYQLGRVMPFYPHFSLLVAMNESSPLKLNKEQQQDLCMISNHWLLANLKVHWANPRHVHPRICDPQVHLLLWLAQRRRDPDQPLWRGRWGLWRQLPHQQVLLLSLLPTIRSIIKLIHPLKSLLRLNFTSAQSKEHVPAFISFSLQNFTEAKTFELRNLQISYLMVEGGDEEEELEDPYQGGLPTCTVAKCPLLYTQYFQQKNFFESTQSSLRKPNLTGNF